MISKMKTKTDDVVGLPFGTMVEWNKQLGKFERLADEIVEDYEGMSSLAQSDSHYLFIAVRFGNDELIVQPTKVS